MVSVVEKDRDALRFLWVDDPFKKVPEVKTLRFRRVVFGVASSPFLLNATIQHHIEQYRSMDAEFVDQFLRSIYVDDVTYALLTSERCMIFTTGPSLSSQKVDFI